MFALIKTNGASHIAIHIPHAGAEKTLPALAAMLEQNATFMNIGYDECTVVNPEMEIRLGDTIKQEGSDKGDIVVSESGAVINAEWVKASPEVFLDNTKAMKKRDDEASRLRNEVSFLKQQLDDLKSQLSALTAESDA